MCFCFVVFLLRNADPLYKFICCQHIFCKDNLKPVFVANDNCLTLTVTTRQMTDFIFKSMFHFTFFRDPSSVRSLVATKVTADSLTS